MDIDSPRRTKKRGRCSDVTHNPPVTARARHDPTVTAFVRAWLLAETRSLSFTDGFELMLAVAKRVPRAHSEHIDVRCAVSVEDVVEHILGCSYLTQVDNTRHATFFLCHVLVGAHREVAMAKKLVDIVLRPCNLTAMQLNNLIAAAKKVGMDDTHWALTNLQHDFFAKLPNDAGVGTSGVFVPTNADECEIANNLYKKIGLKHW